MQVRQSLQAEISELRAKVAESEAARLNEVAVLKADRDRIAKEREEASALYRTLAEERSQLAQVSRYGCLLR